VHPAITESHSEALPEAGTQSHGSESHLIDGSQKQAGPDGEMAALTE